MADGTSAGVSPILRAHWCQLKRLLTKEDETILETAALVTLCFVILVCGLGIGRVYFAPPNTAPTAPQVTSSSEPAHWTKIY